MSIRIAILVSGRGSNMESILRAIKAGDLDAKVEVVISNNPDALALPTARKYGVHAIAIDHRGLTRVEHEKLVLQELANYRIDYVVLAGYMRVLSLQFLQHFRNKNGYYCVINIHPSLLPNFPGTQGYEDAFVANVKESGITIHLVDEQIDHGAILAQEKFPRLEEDTLEAFKARGLTVEHRLYPATLQKIARGAIPFLSQKVPTSAPSQNLTDL